jgi:hypothetical protein
MKTKFFMTYALYQLQGGHEDSDYTIGWIIQILISGRPQGFSPRHPKQLWGSLSQLFNGYWWFFPQGYSCWGMMLTTHSRVWRSKMRSYTSTLPTFLHCVDKNNSTLLIKGEKTSLIIQWKAFRNRWKYEHVQAPHN